MTGSLSNHTRPGLSPRVPRRCVHGDYARRTAREHHRLAIPTAFVYRGAVHVLGYTDKPESRDGQ